MTVTLTYDPTLARVRITATALAAASYATIERSTDQLVWTTIRGGTNVAVTAGSFTSTVDDYEFVSGSINYYRVRGISTAPISFVAAGASSSGASGSRTPGLPAGMAVGDAVLIFASTRNSGTGTVDTPANWTPLASSGNAAVLGRIYDGVWVMPTVTYTAGAANEDTIAQSAAFRNAAIPALSTNPQLNGSAQDVLFPGLTITEANALALLVAWKQDDYTSAAFASMTEIGEASSAAGNDASQVWYYQVQTTATNIAAGTVTITGGAAAISRAITLALPHAPYLNSQTANLTPVLDRVWIKSITRPFLNRAFTVTDWSDPERDGRGAAFGAVNRSLPIGVTDIGGSRRFDLDLYTPTTDDRRTLDYVLASGDILFIHTPANCEVPGGYYLVEGSGERRPHRRATSRVYTVPLKETGPPGPDVVGSTNTWAAVLGLYASWADLIAANPTWADLLARIAAPTEVIVP